MKIKISKKNIKILRIPAKKSDPPKRAGLFRVVQEKLHLLGGVSNIGCAVRIGATECRQFLPLGHSATKNLTLISPLSRRSRDSNIRYVAWLLGCGSEFPPVCPLHHTAHLTNLTLISPLSRRSRDSNIQFVAWLLGCGSEFPPVCPLHHTALL